MEKDTLQKYLGEKFQGGRSFLKEVIFPIFGEDDFEDGSDAELLDNQEEWRSLAKSTGIESVKTVGSFYVGVEPLMIFDITVCDRVKMERNRVNIQRLVRAVMDNYSCAFMLFHYDNDTRWDWRFTFCHKSENTEETTDSKRYTFLLGPGQSCRTAADNFMELYKKQGDIEVEDIEKAFSVEALSNEFFEKYKRHYERFVSYITGKAYVKSGNKYVEKIVNENNDKEFYKAFDNDDKHVRDYVKRLLGRIVFLHFLQKKGWLGVPKGESWDSGKGMLDFMQQLFEKASDEQKADFLDAVLEPLFDAINTNRVADGDTYDTHVFSEPVRVPYLNGGLFERDDDDKIKSRFPSEYFADLLEFFSEYNFTIDENDPNDAQVGIDPEMLSRIFENLLEDNKDKGAFYTPKEVVNYMCRESLIAYLQTDLDEKHKDAIRQFVLTHDANCISDIKTDIDKRLTEVKVCDPAIGSGAFPMGMLKEIFACRCALETVSDNADIKRQIIQNNIYGVDIEKGAVEIARLRFWLSLVVDEKSPETLPNLDFKIMQGNSLITTFHGQHVDLDLKHERGLGSLIQIKKNLKELSVLQVQFYTSSGTEKQNLQVGIKHLILDSVIKQLRYEFDSWKEYNRNTPDLFGGKALKGRKDKGLVEIKEFSKERMDILSECEKLDEYLLDKSISLADRAQKNVPFFDWHIMFYDVFTGTANDGFDIMIGNPPYIQLQNNGGALAQLYENCGYKTFTRTGDIYCLFYERGWQLLKEGGVLCFITSNKWMRAGYGEKTRDFFYKNTNPLLLVDFAGVKIFDSATVDTNILLFGKGKNEMHTVCAVTNKAHKNILNNLSLFVQQQHTVNAFNSSDSWVILSPIEQSIKRKVEAVGVPLKDWNINIYRGVLTGCNDAFIISTAKRDEILANCKTDEERTRTAKIIRPILRGRDIKRYGYDWAGLWLIYIPWHFPLQFDPAIQGASEKAEKAFQEQYPTVYSHMYQYKDQLSKRNKAETGIRYEWYAMQRWGANYWEDFYKPKIIFQEIVQESEFFLDKEGAFMCNDTCRIITGNHLSFLLNVFNSSLFFYSVKHFYGGGKLGENGVRMKHTFFLNFPCLPYSPNIEKLSGTDQYQELENAIFREYGLEEKEKQEIIKDCKALHSIN